jgi:2,4-dienoyl-CoA reductase-like NADH-dependent reductase (Old Yellow Enzyme family)
VAKPVSPRASPVFEPLRIRRLEIAGRLIKTATSETRANEAGFSTREQIELYEPMARAGTPLIITGNVYTSRDGRSTLRQLGADAEDKIPALAELTAAVHRHGSKIFAQLSHCGRQVVPSYVGHREAVSASAVRDLSLGTRPRPLTVAEIHRIVDDFAEAARRCRDAGFDGVQIHGAHGYLVSQFLTPYTNRRKDEYGGSLEGRTKLLRDIHRATRERVGDDFPIILKINGSDWLPLRRGLRTHELVEVARVMEHEGIDAVEVSVGHYESGFPVVRGTFWRCLRGMVGGSVRHLPAPWRLSFTAGWPVVALASNLIWRPREGFNLRYARQFKAALSVPVICVGGFLTLEAMEAALSMGACDAISCGRAFIADPFLHRHLKEGTAGPRCVFCNACVGQIGSRPLDCYHPRVRQEKDAMLAAETAGAGTEA